MTHQNQNPVKALTSGLEQRAQVAFEAGGRLRELERVRWWQQYSDPVFCVFGHYWRTPVPGEKDEAVFTGCAPHATLGSGQAMCIDYSVGARWKERLHPEFRSRYQTQLAALQWPERRLVFDDGSIAPLIEAGRRVSEEGE